MRKIILFFIIAALALTALGCKKPVDNGPGYVPPDLEYPGNDNIDAPCTEIPGAEQTLPFDTNPIVVDPIVTGKVETEPQATSPAHSTPEETTPVYTTPAATEKPNTEPPQTIPTETETKAPDNVPIETEDDFVVPDVIIVPTEIPYVITSLDGYYDFVYNPTPSYFSKGINIYYTVPGEEGVVHMNKLDNYGIMKYIGVHSGGPYDLDIELINFVFSGEFQDVLIERRRNPEIVDMGAVAYQAYNDMPRIIWASTVEDHYIITFNETRDEIVVYTLSDYLKMLENADG